VNVTIACSWNVSITVWGGRGLCGAFTLTDAAGKACNLAAATAGASQACTFTYAGNSAYTVDGSEVINQATGGLCTCDLADTTGASTGTELPFVNGTDGQKGFVFGTGSTRAPGPVTVNAVCQ
jgi:hypothetical protein